MFRAGEGNIENCAFVLGLVSTVTHQQVILGAGRLT